MKSLKLSRHLNQQHAVGRRPMTQNKFASKSFSNYTHTTHATEQKYLRQATDIFTSRAANTHS